MSWELQAAASASRYIGEERTACLSASKSFSHHGEKSKGLFSLEFIQRSRHGSKPSDSNPEVPEEAQGVENRLGTPEGRLNPRLSVCWALLEVVAVLQPSSSAVVHVDATVGDTEAKLGESA